MATSRFLFVILAALLLQQEAGAQGKSRPATAADFTGVFRLLPFPDARQPRQLKENPWPAPCQYFGHYPGGYWLHQQQTRFDKDGKPRAAECKSTIPGKKPGLPQTVTWKPLKDGLVLIDRADFKVQELWKVDRVNGPTHIDDINLNEGDLIMQMINKNGDFIWIRLLRRERAASE